MTTTFDYRVRDQEGNLLRGKVEGESVPVVAGRLREMGYLPISVTAGAAIDLKREIEIPGLTDRVALKDVAVMSRQLATMVAAGLTLVRALGVLSEQVSAKALAGALVAIRSEVERGSAFSAALERHPRIFDELYVAMVRAGEVSGQLDTVLRSLADQLENRVELRRKVRSAFVYPVIVVCVVVAVIGAMLLFVVPTFRHVYASLHGTLPLPTRILLDVSGMLTSLWALGILAALLAALLAVRATLRTGRGRLAFDRAKLKVPIFGPLAHKIALSRFANTLSALLSAGIGVIESLEIAAANVGNAAIAQVARLAEEKVRAGRPLGATLSEHDVMPAMVTQMVETGEEAGAVGELLRKVASFYDSEVRTKVQSLTSVLEPILIVFMGICIGFIVISLYLPMFDYVKLVQG
jgi:type IV pilus assembly protein PilC